MKKAQTIFQAGDHVWRVIARDPERQEHLIDTNEYIVSDGQMTLLTDPGGQEIFPAVFAALSNAVDPRRVTHIFASHQDPDVISSLALWVTFNPALRCYASWLWGSFIPHFGGDESTIIPLPDEGCSIELGKIVLDVVPAHYLHSSGNHNLYDPVAKLLFSGDLGAALLPPDATDLYVTDFDKHIRHCEGFHRRWMGSQEAVRDWCERVSKLSIDFLCPQHGAIYTGRDVGRFIDWLSNLKVGQLRKQAPGRGHGH